MRASRLTRISIRGALILMLGALAPAPAFAQLLSPGPLSRDHARWEGDDHCNRCHASGRGVSKDACLECHQDVRARVRAGRGLHGHEYRNQECGRCHVEHLGRGASLVRWPGGSMARFDHRLSGYELRGAHRTAECRDCHDQRNSRGNPTFIGQRQTCSSCHEDPHDNRFGSRCTDCHDERRWTNLNLDRFDHARSRFALRGKHQQVDCAACHGRPPRYRGIAYANCSSCHEDPHGARFGANCTNCHSEVGWDQLDGMRRHHPGTSLGGGHSRVACRRCHDRGDNNPPSTGNRCVSCHRPVHEARFGNNCATCHGAIRWQGLPDRIGRRAHSRTPFPLNGAHSTTDCSDCHNRRLAPAQRYRALEFGRCVDCHQDRHDGAFRDRDGGECAPCHSDSGFAPTRFGVLMHQQTPFPLEGRHRAAPCTGCHGEDRPMLRFAVERQTCDACHENPHGDQFQAEMRAGGCASCHRSAGWDRPHIDHDTWPLTGAHEAAPCQGCHSPNDADRQTGSGASYRGVSRDCASCHRDEHAGQFRLTEPVRACETCHDTEGFGIEHFDHAGVVGFSLEGAHARIDCAECHGIATLRNGTRVRRYRLGYHACRDCHADPHGAPPSSETTRRHDRPSRRRARSRGDAARRRGSGGSDDDAGAPSADAAPPGRAAQPAETASPPAAATEAP